MILRGDIAAAKEPPESESVALSGVHGDTARVDVDVTEAGFTVSPLYKNTVVFASRRRGLRRGFTLGRRGVREAMRF
jgi:hypothetical protein